jgi:hypothetical protein
MKAMNPDKHKLTKEQPVKKSADAVETPPPPQHMDPSKNPSKEKNHQGRKVKK